MKEDANISSAAKQSHVFRFLSLSILPNCQKKFVRNLEVNKTYVFCDKSLPYGFFGNGVNVSAIVGKNGSGKSSLLNLIHLVFNNLGAIWLQHEPDRPDFVRGVCVKLEFEVDGEDCVVICDDDELCYKGTHQRWAYSINDKVSRYSKFCRSTRVNKTPSALGSALKAFTDSFPFMLSMNYSLMGYVSSGCTDDYSDSWMNAAYRLNSTTYRYPIQFLPSRFSNRLDLSYERQKVNNRIQVVLLMLQKKGGEIIPDYHFTTIKYRHNKAKLAKKISTFEHRFAVKLLPFFNGSPDGCFVVKEILSQLKVAEAPQDRLTTLLKIELFLEVFNQLNESDQLTTFQERDKEQERLLAHRIKDVCKSLTRSNSWDAHNFHRLLNYLHRTINQPISFENGFTIEEYQKWLFAGDTIKSKQCCFSEAIITARNLPPDSFDADIRFKKADSKAKKDLSIAELSGGERQFIYQTSELLFHVFNLMPAKGLLTKYRLFSIVWDEVELCLHPDYQRKYLYWLLKILETLNMKDALCRYNIIVVTHSPFVLSDIPSGNILFLKEGQDCTSVVKETFATNVNDLLRHSFFLEDGFVGEFAKNKLCSLVDYLSSSNPNCGDWTYEKAHLLISLVGDAFLKEQLGIMLAEKTKR